jgi:YggT family protein
MGGSFWSYWYYYLPDYVLALFMYTMLGRVLLSLFLDQSSTNYIWRFFCRLTDPIIEALKYVTPKATAPVVMWLFGVVWLFWLRVLLVLGMTWLGLLARPGGA